MTTAIAVAGDPESRLVSTDHELLRLWLRLFTCSTLIERKLGALLKREFDSTLPRFDLLAQLAREPNGLRMQELSARLLVTGGNVTWLVTSLVRDGLVTRTKATGDGRGAVVKLTATGRRVFTRMAKAHEQWVEVLLGGIPVRERRALSQSLGGIKERLRMAQDAQ